MKKEELKAQYLDYYSKLPVQKLAAAKIGRDEDSIINWRKEDNEFAQAVDQAKADWALARSSKVKSNEWLLERVMNDHFGQKTKTDITTDGKPLQLNINGRLDDRPDKLAEPSVSPPGEVQSLEVRQTGGEDLPGTDDNSQGGNREAR